MKILIIRIKEQKHLIDVDAANMDQNIPSAHGGVFDIVKYTQNLNSSNKNKSKYSNSSNKITGNSAKYCQPFIFKLMIRQFKFQ